jgi:hypothetical protein
MRQAAAVLLDAIDTGDSRSTIAALFKTYIEADHGKLPHLRAAIPASG